jgi:predicted transcriptional regulator
VGCGFIAIDIIVIVIIKAETAKIMTKNLFSYGASCIYAGFILEISIIILSSLRKNLYDMQGSVQYQLSRLEEMRKITSARQGSYKFYFPYGIFKDNEKNILQVLSQETARKILMFIIERNNPTHTDIVNNNGISAASVNWHVRRLIALKIIYEIRLETEGTRDINFLIVLIPNT